MQRQNSKSVSMLTVLLAGIVGYIVIGAIFAIPLKYIFFDYFNRIGWPTDFSYLTTVMIILGLRMLYVSGFWVPKVNVSNTSNK